jgi:DNA-binding response OmpR family regulator
VDLKPKRILVVDDDPDVATMVERLLTDKGFRASHVSNGAEALDAIEADPPALVLLDIDMPEMDGWGFLERLDAARRPPVAFVSGRFDFEAFARGTHAGVVAFISKPIRYQQLIATCERILNAPKRPPHPSEERRRHERRPLLIRAEVLSTSGSSRVIGELRDLSLGGAQMITMSAIEIDAKVLFSLDTAVTGEPMTFDSEVRWRQELPDGYAHGLELVDVGPEQAQRLYGILA